MLSGIAALALTTSPVLAEAALAVGLPDNNPDNGFVYGYEVNSATRETAKATALAICQGRAVTENAIPQNASTAQKGCAVIEVFHGRCVAIAMNGSQTRASSGVGWAVANSKDSANQLAIENCKAMAGKRLPDECWVQNTACDTTEK